VLASGGLHPFRQAIASQNKELNQEKWLFVSEFEIRDSSPPRVFRINHPILIRHGETRECFIVASFAPIAVSFPIQECQTLGQE